LKIEFKYIEKDNKAEITDYRCQMSQNSEDEENDEEKIIINSF
jgi:hypothetical protein